MSFQVRLRPSGHTFDAPPGRTVLDSALEAGLNLPYSCRAGTCRTCKGRVVEGSVDFRGAHPFYLTDAMKREGVALLCKAKPTSDVEIEVEELDLLRIEPRDVPCRIKRITTPVADVAIVELRLPMNENLRFSPGQFIDFLLPDGATRSYSIASAPRAEGVIDLELHIRHTPGGLFTDRLFGSMKAGEMLRFRGPLGTFFLREDSQRPIVFCASGTGLAPIKAMVEYVRQRQGTRPMILYWGGRRPQDLYLHDVVRAWQDELPNFRYVPVLSEPRANDGWQGRTGFVHRAVMQDLPDLSSHQVYVCGAPAMVDAARRDFIGDCGLPEHEFLADAFLTQAEIAGGGTSVGEASLNVPELS
jgi:CDP-4-dehydro-6-deoxyglucose reductase